MRFLLVIGFLTSLFSTAFAEQVRIGIGSFNLNNLPYPLAIGLGYYEKEGLKVTSENFASGGSKALQALIAGSTDVAVGFYDHTIQMQAKSKDIVAIVLLAKNSGLVLAGPLDSPFDPAKPETIKGKKIGITSPGSSSDFFVRYYLTRHGLKASDVSLIAVGSGPTAVAALEQRKIDLLVNYDPAATILTERKVGKILIDARSEKGANEVYGGTYPTSTLYVSAEYLKKNPETVQKIVTATVKALIWANTHSAEDILAKLPSNFVPANRDGYLKAIVAAKGIFSPDGRFDPHHLKTPLSVLAAFDKAVDPAKIDLSKTYTNIFVDKAHQALGH